MSKIHFTKMHGLGNDYIYVDTSRHPIADPATAAIRWSDRHRGIGSDGLVLISPSPVPEADFAMRIFNADGSEAMMCGNASRCIGKYVYERIRPWPLPVREGNGSQETTVRLLTKSGIKQLHLHIVNNMVESVTVDMGKPSFEDQRLYIHPQGNKSIYSPPPAGKATGRRTEFGNGAGGGACLFVSMGNPHYVVFTDDVDQVAQSGPALECHPAFPERCNIEFARVEADGSIRVRVWERGSGVTQACGTGACATAVAAAVTGRAQRQSTIVMDGGTLHIDWRERDGHVLMTGPATIVYEGDIEL